MVEDPLVARIAAREQRAVERANALVSALPLAVDMLRRRGATAVWLFGSLASGAPPHLDTDVDLMVRGVSLDVCAEALLDLEALFRSRVDLVHAESASERLLRRIERDGRDITHLAQRGGESCRPPK